MADDIAEKIMFGPVTIGEIREELLRMDIDLDLTDAELRFLVNKDPDFLLALIA